MKVHHAVRNATANLYRLLRRWRVELEVHGYDLTKCRSEFEFMTARLKEIEEAVKGRKEYHENDDPGDVAGPLV